MENLIKELDKLQDELRGANLSDPKNIEKFKEEFENEYDFLYDNYDKVAGYNEALEEFDNLLKNSQNFKDFITEFVKYRGDFISSDREAVAFMFALEKYI